MRVELLHHDGCPHAPAAHRLIEECLRTLAISAPILVRVGDYPSPTVLVDGIDVMRPAHASHPAGRAGSTSPPETASWTSSPHTWPPSRSETRS